ncbi:MAG TPA: multicopper oxidase domain-containing protein, partial [Steroidobacteraceae bacterium]
MTNPIDRRQLLCRASYAAGGLAVAAAMPAWAQNGTGGIAKPLPSLNGADIALTIARQKLTVEGRASKAVGINGFVPGPIIRLREGQNVRLRVTNDLDEDSSIHWHGLLVPPQFDGVPGISFPGIRPHSTFLYEFPIKQSGTYWYHSHSGFQEQLGLYGPIVIDPAGADPVAYDREHVIVLADH